ncbi:MAG: hypothetical protein HOV79_29945 [Hamadaea sp.]|nr:hypothetical protein [Hamadaea sp.]
MTRSDDITQQADATDDGYPILSTTDRGTRMTQLLPGRPVGRFTAGLLASSLACTALWALVFGPPCAALVGFAPDTVGSPWALAAALVLAYLALSPTMTLTGRVRESFGQARVAGLLASAIVAGGFAVGAGGLLLASFAEAPEPPFDLRAIAESPTIPRELAALLGALAALCAAAALGFLGPALRHARTRQEEIDRLRRTGTRHSGALSALEFRNAWLRNDPLFNLQVTYAADRVVRVHMRTTTDRVPVLGSAMVVFTDDTGSVHVDLDRSAGVTFEADTGRYQPSEG